MSLACALFHLSTSIRPIFYSFLIAIPPSALAPGRPAAGRHRVPQGGGPPGRPPAAGGERGRAVGAPRGRVSARHAVRAAHPGLWADRDVRRILLGRARPPGGLLPTSMWPILATHVACFGLLAMLPSSAFRVKCRQCGRRRVFGSNTCRGCCIESRANPCGTVHVIFCAQPSKAVCALSGMPHPASCLPHAVPHSKVTA